MAIETSCRAGGVALGCDGVLLDSTGLGSSRQHAQRLLPAMRELLNAQGIAPSDLAQLYVSAGPGSFTGLRVGITAARTIAQQLPGLILQAVPTPQAIAENLAGESWEYLGVLLAAKQETVFGQCLGRSSDVPEPLGEARVAPLADLLADWPRPLLLCGEGLGFCTPPEGSDVSIADESAWLPNVESVWTVGERLAAAGQSTPWNRLLPTYARRPEALRLWEQRQDRKN